MAFLKITCLVVFASLLVGFSPVRSPAAAQPQYPPVDTGLLANIFTGEETLHYTISWSGGIKIGDMIMNIRRSRGEDNFVIKVRVTDFGLFHLFYPVDDTFATFVRGPWKLPWRYDVEQREGRGKKTTRITLYDQDMLQVRYRKNDHAWSIFPIEIPAYNEFSSFFVTRALPLTRPTVVPTFVDKKVHQVEVVVLGREKKKTLFGEIDTVKVQPKMNFRGLYDKDGDTVFWLTDNSCRIPVEIRSKILIGSLVSELVEYSNTHCTRQGHPLPGVVIGR